MTIKTKRNIIIALIIAEIFAVSVFLINLLQIPEIVECERLTKKHGHEFTDPWNRIESCWRDCDVTTLIVLKYTSTEADVFYVTTGDIIPGGELGDIITYERNPGEPWKIKNIWRIWGGGGTICGNVMPYWWYNFPAWVLE